MDDSWILEVKVTPKAKENKIVGFDGQALKVRVTEPPEKGKANDAVISLLAKALSLPKRDVTLIAGETSRKKKFLLPNRVQDIIFSLHIDV
ncbi:hypothetical protein CpB0517 [Chlamydia pneumoniae TW-183]|uniref:UPF0235 protein CPn_0497/CP_0257/CPj0497/CpB0517 n=2 Tax=Chlamydia pneumoniae TaxID=83558 RepID=Y497_CHLPN|nr:DUF167 domain-containing protein [Chlamydia pneumoniae]Q9Z854.1 RecName: Full=UPF0235 protein CPn_0497/CP_0257/CPj0497/CpB0517 [Chlamydia pneumoniae]AAD18637.1 CT388 hypothetical protein [Chlamydia pneumoniae CWL029]AAF38120.1 conserved hypothetical protein [Chlamydia pneumoniae AR39]AAP98446.1 hypothetical protein CpB0517 [Chlamydia pneumoniae TW-183]ACZ33474.1 conserved hypothetical protein TIGR00251 [Chlamydia pneumoniae LPCoLN]ETR80397.1 hypothetical protein X556_0280 [Chlamydia pneumo